MLTHVHPPPWRGDSSPFFREILAGVGGSVGRGSPLVRYKLFWRCGDRKSIGEVQTFFIYFKTICKYLVNDHLIQLVVSSKRKFKIKLTYVYLIQCPQPPSYPSPPHPITAQDFFISWGTPPVTSTLLPEGLFSVPSRGKSSVHKLLLTSHTPVIPPHTYTILSLLSWRVEDYRGVS